MKTPSPLRAASLALVLLLLADSAAAQWGRGWMTGFVFGDSDTHGLPGATVELIGDQRSERLRSVRRSVKTDEKGHYSFSEVKYGRYTFRVTADGFAPYEIDLYIGSDMLTQIHVRLEREGEPARPAD